MSLDRTLAEFEGRVVDDETSEPVTDFFVQLGVASPQKPEEISWTQEYHGPVVGKAGCFGLQSIKKGKTWARVLAPGYVPQPVTAEPVEPPVRITELVVRMKRGGELHGIVLDHTGRAAAGARVFLVTEQSLDLTDGRPQKTFQGSAAVTDVEGRFRLRGVSGTEQKVVVVSADRLPAWTAAKIEPGQELKIVLPNPATLIVRYDIPNDATETQLRLQLKAWEMSNVGIRTFVQQPTIANQGQLVLTGLPPGPYDLSRPKMFSVGTESHGRYCDRSTVVLQPGQTQRVDFVRKTGFPIRGEVLGLTEGNAPGAFIYVRPPEATGNPRNIVEEWKLPLYDMVTCDQAGHFSTAQLEPGTYTIVAEAFTQNPPSAAIDTGIRLPDYIGMAKVTVGADAPPSPVKIELTVVSRGR
jgi:hypothetical protein